VAVFSGVIQVISASSTAADNTATANGIGRLAYTITYRVDPRDLDELFQLLTRLIDGRFARSRPAVPDTANWMPNAA
jgi:hypothetical protein